MSPIDCHCTQISILCALYKMYIGGENEQAISSNLASKVYLFFMQFSLSESRDGKFEDCPIIVIADDDELDTSGCSIPTCRPLHIMSTSTPLHGASQGSNQVVSPECRHPSAVDPTECDSELPLLEISQNATPCQESQEEHLVNKIDIVCLFVFEG